MVQALGRRDDSRGCNDLENLLGETESLTNAARGRTGLHCRKKDKASKERAWERDWSERR